MSDEIDDTYLLGFVLEFSQWVGFLTAQYPKWDQNTILRTACHTTQTSKPSETTKTLLQGMIKERDPLNPVFARAIPGNPELLSPPLPQKSSPLQDCSLSLLPECRHPIDIL